MKSILYGLSAFILIAFIIFLVFGLSYLLFGESGIVGLTLLLILSIFITMLWMIGEMIRDY